MERHNRVAIDDICGTLVEVREKASQGAMVYWRI